MNQTGPRHLPPNLPLQQGQSQWHQDLAGGDQAFANPEAYRAWEAVRRLSGPQTPGLMPWQPQDSWKPSVNTQAGYAPSYLSPRADGLRPRGNSVQEQKRSTRSVPTSYDYSPNHLVVQSLPTEDGKSAYHSLHHQAVPSIPSGLSPQSLSPVACLPVPSQSTSFDSSASHGMRGYSTASFVVTLPPAEYIELSKRKPLKSTLASITPKLLVLDLNGALIYRHFKSPGEGRKSYPRPYLSSFLEYLFLPEPSVNSSARPPTRPWEVFVWSSAQPQNVRPMVELGFGSKWSEGIWKPEAADSKAEREARGEGRLLGVWARDRMGLKASDYGKKVQTIKDLRKPIQHLKNSDPDDLHRTVHSFDEATTVLLDDSPRKGVLQPWNQIVIPEYDRMEHQGTKAAVARVQQDGQADRSGLDETLLGVVGILEELRTVENVPAWVRAGGLVPKLPAANAENVQSIVVAAVAVADAELTLESLPTHESFVHWYQIHAVLHYWTERGKQALIRKGIAIDIGANITGSPDSPFLHLRSLPDAGHFPRPRRNARWSPSRPASTEPCLTPSPQPTRLVPSQIRRSYHTVESHASAPDAKRPSLALARSHIDQWRTFRAIDVSRYLEDVADRPSPLDQQRRAVVLQTADLLRAMSPDASFDAPPFPDESANQGFLPNMCDMCTLHAGEMYTQMRNAEARAAPEPMPSTPNWHGNRWENAEWSGPIQTKNKWASKKQKASRPFQNETETPQETALTSRLRAGRQRAAKIRAKAAIREEIAMSTCKEDTADPISWHPLGIPTASASRCKPAAAALNLSSDKTAWQSPTDRSSTMPKMTVQEKCRQLAEAVLIGEDGRMEEMSTQTEVPGLADEEIAELLIPGGPMEIDEVEDKRSSKRRHAEPEAVAA